MIYCDEPEGRKLLSDVRDGKNGCYQPILHGIFSQQTTRAGCGIQSCALLLSANAIGCHMKSNHHQGRSVTDTLHQPVTSVPTKRRKTGDTKATTGQTNHQSSSQSTVPEQPHKQTLSVEKDISPLQAKEGYASSSVVFTLPYTEVGLYSMPQTLTVTRRELVASGGLTLSQVAGILQAHACVVWTVHATSTTVAQFRRDLLDVLSSADSCSGMIVNFHRGLLTTGARKSHHSPVAAYHKVSDNLLVLDTAAPVERHFWTSVEAMFNAMLTLDHVTAKSRGYCFFIKTLT